MSKAAAAAAPGLIYFRLLFYCWLYFILFVIYSFFFVFSYKIRHQLWILENLGQNFLNAF